MLGLMQDWPLLCHTALDHAATSHGEQEVVTRTVEGSIHRESYADLHYRARKVAQALLRLGISPGERVGTLAWNTHRHMETWYGALGIGAIYHTINPRLFADQIAYIINHAEDKLILTDLTFVSLLEEIAHKLDTVKSFVILTDDAHMPQTKLKGAISFENLIEYQDGDFAWQRFDENSAAGLCYTSGTTGNPKGVLYSHRSLILHSLAINGGDVLGLRAADTIMPIVPMFHANAWAIPFCAPMAGTKLVLPGDKLDGPSVCELLTSEKVTTCAGVPTVFLMMLDHLEKTGSRLPDLKRITIGGAAVPLSMFETFELEHGIEVSQGWGMTEMSPVGTFGALKPKDMERPTLERLKLKTKQGRAIYTVEMKIVRENGSEVPHDGIAYGHLKVRGPAISRAYFKGVGGEVLDADGFFDTGDIATIDERGYMQITDRAKDVIKSGGEWISSIEIENTAMGHPDVAEAAVIGIKHPKWDERPLLIIVAKPGKSPTKEKILGYLTGRIAKWWMPDDVVFVKEIPHTATGKMQKRALKVQYKDYKLPTV